jgi:putative FmdB family regulatory protein
MPLYEYQCKECGIRFERTQSFNDAPLTTCPECEGEVYRVIGATGVIFKGSGFYVTDNRKSSSGGSSHHAHAKGEESGGESKSTEKAATPSTEKASVEKTSTSSD